MGKQTFRVTTFFTYSVTKEIECENENLAWIEGRKQAIDAPMEDMEFVGIDDTLVMDEQLNIVYEG
jgi:hypothetical protein